MKIYTATPKPFLTADEADSSFFTRDTGLTCHSLQKMGVESKVVLLDGSDVKKHPDIIRASLEQMASEEWWRSFRLDAVVLYSWAAPRYTPIAKAIKAGGAKLIVRCDSGEPYSQWQKTVREAFYTHYLAARYKGKGWAYACGATLLKTPLFYIPALYDNRVVENLSHADLILNETPDGVQLLKELLIKKGRIDIAERVRYSPHPIVEEAIYDPAVKKEKRIIAVGRWDNYQKNAPLLIRTVGKVLAEQSDYEAHIFGGGEEVLRELTNKLPEEVRSRIFIRGKVSPRELIREYQKSRILFMPSRSEGSSVAAEEALVCGCSVVGSRHIFCMRNFVSKKSGTLSQKYNAESLKTALEGEIHAWDSGQRDSEVFSTDWQKEFFLQPIEVILRERNSDLLADESSRSDL
jgi:glycosyltransferase involved in cell wall biosynthesis